MNTSRKFRLFAFVALGLIVSTTTTATARPSIPSGGPSAFLEASSPAYHSFGIYSSPDQPKREGHLGAASDKVHTYFVAASEKAAAVWVHNVCHSKILGQNLLGANQVRPANTAAHHIVAWDDPRAAVSRSILQRAGIGIDEAHNGIFLPRFSTTPAPPGVMAHSTLHTSVYHAAVERELLHAVPGTERRVLARIAARLTAGTFPK